MEKKFGYLELMEMRRNVASEKQRIVVNVENFRDDSQFKKLAAVENKINEAWGKLIDELSKKEIEVKFK